MVNVDKCALNETQKVCWTVLETFIDLNRRVFFLEGDGQSGKSTLVASFAEAYSSRKKIFFALPTLAMLSLYEQHFPDSSLDVGLLQSFLGLASRFRDEQEYFESTSEDTRFNDDKYDLIIVDGAELIHEKLISTLLAAVCKTESIKVVLISSFCGSQTVEHTERVFRLLKPVHVSAQMYCLDRE